MFASLRRLLPAIPNRPYSNIRLSSQIVNFVTQRPNTLIWSTQQCSRTRAFWASLRSKSTRRRARFICNPTSEQERRDGIDLLRHGCKRVVCRRVGRPRSVHTVRTTRVHRHLRRTRGKRFRIRRATSGHYRVVTDAEGNDEWELNVSTDAAHKRASIPSSDCSGRSTITRPFRSSRKRARRSSLWVTDVLPESFAAHCPPSTTTCGWTWSRLTKAGRSTRDQHQRPLDYGDHSPETGARARPQEQGAVERLSPARNSSVQHLCTQCKHLLYPPDIVCPQ